MTWSWDLFFRLFSIDVPEELLMAVAFVCLLVTVSVIRFCADGHYRDAVRMNRNRIAVIWAMGYIVLMLWITVISRLDRTGDVMRYDLMPLWSIDSIKDGFVETLYEKVYNVLFFIPLGIITAIANIKWWKVLLFGIGTSVTIELLQLIIRTGLCETDDVLCNTSGFIIGFAIIRSMIRIIKKLTVSVR